MPFNKEKKRKGRRIKVDTYPAERAGSKGHVPF